MPLVTRNRHLQFHLPVSWSFLREVLIRKAFHVGFIQHIMSLVSGGQTLICINGERCPCFCNKRGLRQGDPISPLLFDIIADAISSMISKAKEAGHLKCVISHLIPGRVTHLQYVGDTLLLFEHDPISIATITILLIYFEAMSGLKINYAKSELRPGDGCDGRPTHR